MRVLLKKLLPMILLVPFLMAARTAETLFGMSARHSKR